MDKTVVFLVISAFMLGLFTAQSFHTSKSLPAPALVSTYQSTLAPVQQPKLFENSVTTFVPAITDNGSGVVMPLTVQRITGYGATLVNINNVTFWPDTQDSIRTAKLVAEGITGVDTGEINLAYIVGAHASLLEGPSAGAAITVATVAVLEGKPINESVSITGTINSDGTIGPVGGVLEKAKAAKRAGAKLFLVPEGGGTETVSEPEKKCSTSFGITYCEITNKTVTVNVGDAAGITVREVYTIDDATPYFFS